MQGTRFPQAKCYGQRKKKKTWAKDFISSLCFKIFHFLLNSFTSLLFTLKMYLFFFFLKDIICVFICLTSFPLLFLWPHLWGS